MPELRTRLGRVASLFTLALLLAGAPVPRAEAQRSEARTQRAALRTASQGRSAAATRARAQRVSALLGRENAGKSPMLRRYVREALPDEVERLATAHDRQSTAATPRRGELVSASRLAQILRRARAIDPEAVPDGTIDHVEQSVANTRYRARVGRHETAVEIEADTTNAILEAMETEDGTVGPILREGGQPAPEFIRERANGGSVESVSFTDLNAEQRLSLLQSQGAGRSFFSNRRIPGVRFPSALSNRRADGTTRLRRASIAGRRQSGTTIAVDRALMRQVEYRGPTEVEEVSGVEIHVRQTGPAARNLRDARTVEQLLDIETPGRHQHVTAQLPPEVRTGDPISRAQFVDFYRRVNVVAELEAFRHGAALQAVRDGAVTYFDFLSSNGLRQLDSYLRQVGAGQSGYMGSSSLKMAAVGFRPGSLYSDPRVVGFEARTLYSMNGTSPPPRSSFRLVTAIQRGLVGRAYGVPRTRVANWYRRAVEEAGTGDLATREGNAVERLHYNRAIRTMVDEAPSHLTIGATARETLLTAGAEDYSVKMLVHDFSADPVFDGQPAALRRVERAQQRAISALEAGEDVRPTVERFVQSSNLYRVFAQSIGM